ncbi:C6 zinc finger protein [Podospora australis]|uniref:C6 zinc finger protein n=1 Tax=Podospora australis TaxID=1536484 RepID=A0AAN6WR12_9PEZI|nr:C6 zinc finger protein [Podospora australis]
MNYTSNPALALLSLEQGQAEFDYTAFLQDQDIDYLAEESSASTSSNHFSGPGTVVQPQLQPQPATNLAVVVQGGNGNGAAAAQKTRLERRGHTKSRRGCFNCKRRRIKCQETRPACGHCTKTGLPCEYPSLPTILSSSQPSHQIPLFSMQDMRFFQHFLVSCYPHHPIGSETIWTHEVPCLSQKYEYLMHAILGYSASELMVSLSDQTLTAPAMAHRLKAIKAIKRTLAASSSQQQIEEGGCESRVGDGKDFSEEGNALMAACFALTYQSVLLDDGMVEYMTFIRGIMIVAMQMYVREKGSAKRILFGDFMGQAQTDRLAPYMAEVPLINKDWVDGAVRGLEGMEGLVRVEERQVERRYWEMLIAMGRELYVSSWGAYLAMTNHYAWWMMLPHDQFQKITEPGNQVAILLATHWIALKQVMAVITETEDKGAAKWPERPPSGNDISVGIIRWLKYLNKMVDVEHLVYNQWPMWVEAQLDRDRGFFGKTH